MGRVYRARDLTLERDVALKFLPSGVVADEAARARIHAEALSLAKLNHPNIATLHELGTWADVDFLVTEYIPGTTLDSKLRVGPLSQGETVRLGTQLALGLEAAHEQGIIHRDVKPGNLRLTPKGQLKILDFGLAKLQKLETDSAVTESLVREGPLAGTLPYMAPEQIEGEELDGRSDIWAAGAVLYEMATGQRAFPEKQGPRLIDHVLHHPPALPSSINHQIAPGLESVILKALDKDPERRYQSARELRVDLNRLLGSRSASKLEMPDVARAVAPRTRKMITAGIILALPTLVAVAGLRWAGRNSASKAHSPRILAVLPFRAVNADSATGALGIGMTETLSAKLAQVTDPSTLQLVSTGEVESHGVETSEQARREFGANLVLEGSLQQAGSELRVNCSLVDVATHRQLGARSITAPDGDIFGAEDQVVSEAMSILSVELPADKRAEVRIQPDTKPEAYQHYVRGLGYLDQYDKAENIESAIAEFGLALKIDPNYARAYAGTGLAYYLGFQQSNRTNDWINQAQENCRKGLAINADIAEGHTCLGDVQNGRGEYREAIEEFKRAVEIDNHNDGAIRGLAEAYEKMGDIGSAVAAYQQSIALRPQYWAGYNALGVFYFRQSKYPDAVKMFERVVQLAPENFQGYSDLGAALTAEGQYSQATQALQRSIEIRPTLEAYSNLGAAYFCLRHFADAAAMYQKGLSIDDHDSLIWGNLGEALYWTPGRRTEAAAAYRKAISIADSKLRVNPRDGNQLAFVATYNAMLGNKSAALSDIQRSLQLAPEDAEVKFRAALVYNHFGDTDRAVALLEKAVAAGYPSSLIRDTPDFDALRKNRRFGALLQKH
jgi:tetratricopeptide (TPR) repeat protein/TolB-like protein